jgi:DNA-binding FadR family transcriptional regulator
MSNSLGWSRDNNNHICASSLHAILTAHTTNAADIVMGLVNEHDQLVAACDKAESEELKAVCRRILGRG